MINGIDTTDHKKSRGFNENWKALYIVAGVAALIAAIFFRRWLGAELSLLRSIGIFKMDSVYEPVMPGGFSQGVRTNRLA